MYCRQLTYWKQIHSVLPSCSPNHTTLTYLQSLVTKLFPELASSQEDEICSIQGGTVKGGNPKCPDASPPSGREVTCRLITNLPAIRPQFRPPHLWAKDLIASSQAAVQGKFQEAIQVLSV